MALPQGIAFGTSAAQPAGWAAESGGGPNYPHTTAQGNTVGWEQGVQTADRGGSGDVRLRGIAYNTKTSTYDFRIDLPSAGAYNVRAAMGDLGFNHPQRLRIVDTSTVIVDNDAGNVSSTQYADATGVIRTSGADWVANNALQAATFTTTICRFRFGGSVGTNDPNWTANAVYIESAAPTSVSGSITWTEANDSIAAAGAASVTAAASWAEASDTAALAGSAKVTAAASWTEASDTAAIAAAASASASAAWTEASDSAAIAASATVSGSAAYTESSDAMSVAGMVGNAVAISAAWTEANDATQISASASIAASASWQEASDSLNAGGMVGNAVAGNAAWTEANDSATLLGTLRISASAGWAEANDSASIAGTVAAAQTGAIAWTEQGDVFAIAGNVAPQNVSGAIYWREADDYADYGLVANPRYMYAARQRTRTLAGQTRTRMM